MFDHHRKSPWFAEKYDPAPQFQDLRTRVRKDGWKGRVNSFLLDLELGKFDSDLNELEPEPTYPVKGENGTEEIKTEEIKTEENKTEGVKTEEVKMEEIKVTGGDDEMQFNIDADEEVGDNEANRPDTNGKSVTDNRRNNRGEEIFVPIEGNQVMIRTIPPDIGRVKLEEVGPSAILGRKIKLTITVSTGLW